MSSSLGTKIKMAAIFFQKNLKKFLKNKTKSPLKIRMFAKNRTLIEGLEKNICRLRSVRKLKWPPFFCQFFFFKFSKTKFNLL